MMIPSPLSLRTALVLSLAASSAAAQSLFALHGETILAVGDLAPGIPGATINSSLNFDAGVIDQNGTVLFRARLAGPATDSDRAYFLGRSNGDLQLVVQANTQAPGTTPGTAFRTATSSAGLQAPPRISPFGELLLFRSKLYNVGNPGDTPTSSDTGIFYGPVGALSLVAREGEQVPFLPAGVLWGEMDSTNLPLGQFYNINASGQVLFTSPLAGAVTTGDDAVLVTGDPSSLQIVSREGDTVAGGAIVSVQATTPTGSVVLGFSTLLNASGMVLHDMRFSTTSGTAQVTNDRALAIWSGGVDNIIAREGDPAPGTAGAIFGNSGNTWTVDGVSQFTASGYTTMNAQLFGGDVSGPTNDRAIYYGGIPGWTMIARTGDAVPGLPGVTFASFNNAGIACNDDNQVVFLASLAGAVTAADDSALMFSDNGVLTVLAREGSPAVFPGLLAGSWIYESMASGGTATPRLNERGQILWQPNINDGSSSRTIMVARTPAIGWQLVFDRSETITTAAGTGALNGVSTIGSGASADGGVGWFNNDGDVLLRPSVAAPVTATMARVRVGSLVTRPAAVSAASPVPHTFAIDCGAAQANQVYLVIGSVSGTRPGTPFPGGPTIPLNIDSWLNISLAFANSAIYTNTLGLLDAQGKASASFNLPPGLPGAAGTLIHHAVVALDLFTILPVFASEPSALEIY
jgi:hypothetical protein